MRLKGLTSEGVQRIARRMGGNDSWTALDTFTTAYIEAALWSSTDQSDDQGGRPLDDTYGIEDLSEEAIKGMASDCAAFQEANRYLMDEAEEQHGMDDEQAGHDFWLTRNGHGAGFWDRGMEEIGDVLSDAAKSYGSCDLYVGDDGQLYVQ